MAQPTTGCLHDYQLTPDDMKHLQEANVLVVNGAGMEFFMDKVLSGRPGIQIVEASKGLDLITAADGEPNPHIWVSVTGAIDQVKNIGEQLGAIDPNHAAAYRTNTLAYVRELMMLRDTMHKALDGVAKREIVTFHEAFPYFAQEFGLKIVAIIQREPGSDSSDRSSALETR